MHQGAKKSLGWRLYIAAGECRAEVSKRRQEHGCCPRGGSAEESAAQSATLELGEEWSRQL